MYNSDLTFYIIASVIIVALIFCLFFTRAAIVKRKLRKTGEKKISDFQNGEVAKAIGTIIYSGKTLIAPLSGRKCVYYHTLVEERRSGGKNHHWHTIIEEEIAGDVVIKDGRYYAMIETGMVKSYLVDDKQYTSGFMEDATKPLEDYLTKHRCESVGWIGMNKKIRYKEGILEEGETLVVVGKGNWKRKSELQFEIPAERILVIGPDDQEPVYFSDDPVTVT